MSAAIQVRVERAGDAYVDTSDGCRCIVDPGDPLLPRIAILESFVLALDFAVAHAATHTCPSWRASGEPCSPYCTDCGGRGWVATGSRLASIAASSGHMGHAEPSQP